MIRTQIQLTEEQARKLRKEARQQGVSLAALIRRCVDRGLTGEKQDRAKLYERAAGLVGRFADRKGVRDLARAHDRYLDQAFE
jgi:L-serine deaminase